ncbi:thiol-disulfide oxidoreductase DCC family protein [Chitinolyticbacter meiyuanensis]|uniref:thiol-disulfide oxidoreductase DCC family protein n=1 Tax=Chitinolyticbacter meiyuanensis TaxID=682798 RepID=UPI0016522ABF|nr:DUF393 domain-containing protein [Chitinolyticbacter meiyuanensis]
MLTIWYDGSCPFCSRSMHALQRRAPHALRLIDAADPAVDVASHGLQREALMHSLHVEDGSGRRQTGFAAVYAVFAAAGLGWLAWPLRIRPLQPLWQYAYAQLARNRYLLSTVLKLDCPNGSCTLRATEPRQ